MSNLIYESTLYHHGIKGQKWGVRRFQNKDGSWTGAGAKRYGEGGTSVSSKRAVSNGENDDLPGHTANKKITTNAQRDKVKKLGRSTAKKVDADTRKKILDSYEKLLDADDEDDYSYDGKAYKEAANNFYNVYRPACLKYLGIKLNDNGHADNEYDRELDNGFLLGLEDLEYDLSAKHSDNDFLYHHGIKGQKWGVRRFQNKDGSYTSKGKARRSVDKSNSSGSRHKVSSRTKKIAAMAAIGAITVTAAAVYVHKNPEKIGKTIGAVKNVRVKDLGSKAIKRGKEYTRKAFSTVKQSVKEGVKEGLRDAPKKAVKAVMIGMAMNETKKLLDQAVGKEEAAKIFQANDNKKIGKFWRVGDQDKDDDE